MKVAYLRISKNAGSASDGLHESCSSMQIDVVSVQSIARPLASTRVGELADLAVMNQS